MQPRVLPALFAILVVLYLATTLPVCAFPGLITKEGPTGMFLNPLAEVSPPKTINAQTCWLRQELPASVAQELPERVAHWNIFMLAHTLPTATELGLLGNLNSPEGGSVQGAVGGFLRQLVVPEAQWLSITPALAVGATAFHTDISTEGFNTRATAFAALSKTLTPPEFWVPVRAHLGGRFVNFATPTDASDVTGYIGLEVGVLRNLRLIGEVNTRTTVDTTTPFAVGLQFSLAKLGISVAAINTGQAETPGLFFGIGFPFATE